MLGDFLRRVTILQIDQHVYDKLRVSFNYEFGVVMLLCNFDPKKDSPKLIYNVGIDA
jgi:hypothetical protein